MSVVGYSLIVVGYPLIVVGYSFLVVWIDSEPKTKNQELMTLLFDLS